MPCLRTLLLLACAAATPGLAQNPRIDAAQNRLHQTPPHSAAYFVAGCELVDAWVDYHIPTAIQEARKLRQQAAASDVPGASSATTVLQAFVVCRDEGSVAARALLAELAEPPAATDEALRACYLMLRARSLCQLGEHANELQWAVPAQASAERSGDVVLRVRCALATVQATPKRNLAGLLRTIAAIDEAGHGSAIEFLRPWLWIEQLQEALARKRDADAAVLQDRIAEAAERHGNLRLRAVLRMIVAQPLANRREFAAANAIYEAALQDFQRLGDRMEAAAVLDFLGCYSAQLGQTDAAEQHLAAAERLIEGRGYEAIEHAILGSRFDLALKRRDGNAAAVYAEELQRRRNAEREHEAQLTEARERLQAAEEARAAAAAAAVAAAEASARETLLVQVYSGSIGLVVLAALLAVLWRSRLRLQAANAALAEQMRKLESARTVQTQLEQRLRELERAEGLQAFAAGIAHDFNNLLTAVLGNTQLVRASLADPELQAQLDAVLAAGQKAAQLCRQLQQGEHGNQGQREPLPLHAATRELLPVLRASVRCAVELLPAQQGEVVAAAVVRAQWEQVLLSLVTNAADAHARNVQLRVGRVSRMEGFQGPVAVLEVVDDGDGMPPELAQRIFDPFFTTRFPGRGLGLALVQGIVHRHGGQIHAESEVGVGSTFTVNLPLLQLAAPVAVPEPVVLPRPPRKHATILLVDDEPAVRRVLERQLRRLEHAVMAFADGPALLAALAAIPADRAVLVFADLGMPGMDGQEVLQRVQALRPSARRVLISGHPEAYLQQLAGEAAEVVLGKPFDAAQLHACVEDLLVAADTTPA